MSSSTPLFIRSLQNPYSNSTGFHDEPTDGRDAYEFVAFLLWYLFLVICCVLPTCCAYRRRRLMEARITQQQASFDQLHQQNVFILSNLHLRADMDGEEARAERTKRITDALKITTFTVAEKDIEEKTGDVEAGIKRSTIHVDEDLEAVLDHEAMDDSALSLPSNGPNASRSVPGGCAICLCPYEPGDQVAWSGESCCQHAFHSECIIPWLAKKSEPKCPCCRQDYCIVEPVTASDLTPVSPFGFIPSTLLGQTSGTQIMTENGIFPNLGVVAPQLGTETASTQGNQTQIAAMDGDNENADDNQTDIGDVEQQLEMVDINEENGGSIPSTEEELAPLSIEEHAAVITDTPAAEPSIVTQSDSSANTDP